ncbi:hypothetical protein PMIT1320_00453 [Prochlorococcus marinus str. MIT 1320]|nr:hypothetical protein PMIT1320_00453 [Prochlorococcus marinus str. MIT 1320]
MACCKPLLHEPPKHGQKITIARGKEATPRDKSLPLINGLIPQELSIDWHEELAIIQLGYIHPMLNRQ